MTLCEISYCDKESHNKTLCSYHRMKLLLKGGEKPEDLKIENVDKIRIDIKLTDKDVSDIRDSYDKVKVLSEKYNVSVSMIYKVKSGLRR